MTCVCGHSVEDHDPECSAIDEAEEADGSTITMPCPCVHFEEADDD